MTKAAEARSNAIAYTGGCIMVLNTGRIAWSAADQPNLGAQVLPCDMRVGFLGVRVEVAATSALALLNVTIQGDTDSHFDGWSANGKAAGYYDLTNDVAWVNKVFLAGSTVSFDAELATAVGSFAATLILVPA